MVNNIIFYFIFVPILALMLLILSVILTSRNFLSNHIDKEFSMRLNCDEKKLIVVLLIFNILIIYNNHLFIIFLPSSLFLFICIKIFKDILMHSDVSIKKFLINVLSEYNMSSRLVNCLTYFISPAYFIYDISLIKFISLIFTRIFFLGEIHISDILKLSMLTLGYIYISPLFSICAFELFTCSMNPGSTKSYDTIEERLRDLAKKEPTLKESIINSGDTDFNHLVAGDINEYNITKANICCENMEKESRSFGGSTHINERARCLVDKLNRDYFLENGSSIHSKLTYDELALLKFYGKNFPAKMIQGYNGIMQNGDFTDQQPNNINITKSLNPNKSAFGFYFSQQVNEHKGYLMNEIKKSNNQTWVVR